MAIEIEKKYRLDAAQRQFVSTALKEIGAEFKGEDFEENILYSGGVLDSQNAILRVRKIDGKAILTYKQRIENQSGIKHQTEHETSVGDAEELDNIIESLGYQRRLIYEKRRETWKFRESEIVLDELPFGLFTEIEGSITAIKELEVLLDIEDFETEHKTYPRLTMEFGQKNGDLIEARFA